MKQKHTFRPRARLLQLLGDQLIGDARIAVFELVKNAYDADSSTASVVFKNIEQPEKASIEIFDSGDGMDVTTIKEIWLEPGADHREKQRLGGLRSKNFQRLPLGEKGVGRFAAHKLGNKISLITRKSGKDEIVVEIDWEKLVNERYLGDAVVIVETRSPQIFTGRKHGTKITISALRNKWTRGEVRRLYRSINSISRPFDKKNGFSVDLKFDPDPKWTEGLLSAKDIEEQALFSFDFTLSGSRFDYKYEFRPLDSLVAKAQKKKVGDFTPREVDKKSQLLEYFVMESDEDGKKKKRKVKADLEQFGIGCIRGKIIGFDRDKEILSLYVDSKGLTDHLDNNGGIRVYRDGIRVYNYGEPGTDWLGLDERRVQIPTRRIGNNLVLGEIHLDLENSQKLIEKTNREGFVENSAYEELRKAVLSVVIAFEQEREIDKNRIRELLKNRNEDEPFPSVHGPEEAIDALRTKVAEKGWSKELTSYIDRVEETYQEVRDTLLQAVGTGLGLSIVFHELERGVRDLNGALNSGEAKERIKSLSRHLVELMDGASYFVRTATNKSFKASDVVEHAIFGLSARFDYHDILLTNAFSKNKSRDFSITGSRQMITASIVNLIDNAIYWLNLQGGQRETKNGQKKRIWVGPSPDESEFCIIVADNGPGIEDSPDVITKPFFTRKQDGMGIGLYFVNMTMQSHGGQLEFPAPVEAGTPSAYTGAVVSMKFARKK